MELDRCLNIILFDVPPFLRDATTKSVEGRWRRHRLKISSSTKPLPEATNNSIVDVSVYCLTVIIHTIKRFSPRWPLRCRRRVLQGQICVLELEREFQTLVPILHGCDPMNLSPEN